MPKRKTKKKPEDTKKSLSRVDSIMKKIRFRNAKEEKEIRQALESVLANKHIAGIKKTTPTIELDRNPLAGDYLLYGKGKYVFKISIATTKTRKTFGFRA